MSATEAVGTGPVLDGVLSLGGADRTGARQGPYAWVKRGVDLLACLLFLPFLLFSMGLLLVLNPFVNRGDLFFRQERMGRGCRPFTVWKFRTMAPPGAARRGAFDPLEEKRITPLGKWLRRTHLDELPQIINVLRGEMSLIGPRPDVLSHARQYLVSIPGYRDRHAVLPGISGYAQIELGYVDNAADVRAKVDCDLHYVRNAGLWMDLCIAFRTVPAMLGGKGRGA